jgi:hypothetical protein
MDNLTRGKVEGPKVIHGDWRLHQSELGAVWQSIGVAVAMPNEASSLMASPSNRSTQHPIAYGLSGSK